MKKGNIVNTNNNLITNNILLINNITPNKKFQISSTTVKQSTIKRKFKDTDYMKEDILEKTLFIKNKIDDIYEKYLNNYGEWKEELKFELKQENIVDINGDLPRSLNTRGSHLLEYTKFWILFIEMKFPYLDLMETVEVFNNALLYEQSDFNMLHKYLNKLMSENFDILEIYTALEKVNGVGNHFRVPEKVEDLTIEHYKYLLDKPELFSAEIKINQICGKTGVIMKTPFSSKTKKLNNNRVNIINEYNTNSASQHNIFPPNIFNTTANISNLNTTAFNAINSVAIFKLTDSDSSKKKQPPSEIKNQNNYEMSFQADLKISNSKLKENIRHSQGINTSFDYNMINNKNLCDMTYKELVDRNKFNLVLENTCIIEMISEVTEKTALVRELESRNGEENNEINSNEEVGEEGELKEEGGENVNNKVKNKSNNNITKVKNKNKKRGKSVKNRENKNKK